MTSEILNHFQSDLQCAPSLRPETSIRHRSPTIPPRSVSERGSFRSFSASCRITGAVPGNSRDVCGTSGALLTRENPEQRKDDELGGRFVPTGAAVASRLTPAGRGLFDMCGEMRR